MASRYKGRAGLSRSSKTKSSATGTRGCQRSLYSFMESKPKATQAPQQLSPIVSSSPFAKTEMVSSTSGSDINAGEKRKKAEVIELTSDEDEPPLKRRKLVVDSSSPTRLYQVLTTEKSSMAKQLASGSPRKWTMPDFAASTPCSDPKTYFRGLQLSDLQSQRPQEGRGRSGEPSSPVDLPTFPPEGGHEVNTVRVDMELDMVPCSQVQDDLPLAFPPIAFPPIAPSTLASPLRPITPPPQRNSLFLPTFTPKLVQVSQQQVPSSATPSDLRESCDVHIMRTEAPHVPVFTLSSPNYIEERPQTTDLLLPSSSFPRFSESPCLLANLTEENELHAQELFPASPYLSKQVERIESSQIEESFEFAFHIPPPPPPSRKPLRRRAPCVSVDGTVTRDLWSGAFDALAATQQNDPTAAQSPRKGAFSSPIKPVAEALLLSEEETQKNEEEGDEGTSHEQSSFRPFCSPPPTKPSWPTHTPQRQPSPLRLLHSQTSNTASTSPTKRLTFPSPSKISAFLSPPSKPGVFRSPSQLVSATASPSKHTPPTSQRAPFMTPTRLKFPTSTGPEGSPSAVFGGPAYVSPPKLLPPHPGGSTPVSHCGEEVGISQYPESLADESLPDFLLTFGESQGMEDWIKGMQMQN